MCVNFTRAYVIIIKLSDFLVCPALATSAVPKRPTTHARLLTSSDEGLRLLEKKQQKKELEKRIKKLQREGERRVTSEEERREG